MIELESEQWLDLRWAADTIDGRGDGKDDLHTAVEIARSISTNSASQAIRQAADLLLANRIHATVRDASAACAKYPPKLRSVRGG